MTIYFPTTWTSGKCLAWIKDRTGEPFVRDRMALGLCRHWDGGQFWFTFSFEYPL